MLEFLLQFFEQISFFTGFIKNGIYPEPFNAEQEDEMVKEWLNNKSKYAREQLIEHNLRLVVHVAKKYDSKNETIDELVSIGILGLIKAVDSFSDNKGVRLATYAAKCIDNEILMYLRNNKKSSRNVSLFDAIGQDKDGTIVSLIDVVPSSDLSLDDQLDRNNKLSKLAEYLHKLEPRELEVLKLRYGLGNGPEYTQKEVAKKFHISRSYVSRIEKRALTKLLQEFRKDQII